MIRDDEKLCTFTERNSQLSCVSTALIGGKREGLLRI
jgi:hypothetical protein